jgi:hypothetical protein
MAEKVAFELKSHLFRILILNKNLGPESQGHCEHLNQLVPKSYLQGEKDSRIAF